MRSAWPYGDPRDVARSIVADARFHLALDPRPSREPSLLAAFWSWCVHILRAIFGDLARAASAADTPLGAAIGFAVIAATLGLAGYLGLAIWRSFKRATRARTAGGGEVRPRLVAEQSARVLRIAALAAAREGRYREAATTLFLAAVRTLDERGEVPYDAARTPGEYRRIVRNPHFDALAADAVVALFAATQPGADLFKRMNASYDRMFGAGEA